MLSDNYDWYQVTKRCLQYLIDNTAAETAYLMDFSAGGHGIVAAKSRTGIILLDLPYEIKRDMIPKFLSGDELTISSRRRGGYSCYSRWIFRGFYLVVVFESGPGVLEAVRREAAGIEAELTTILDQPYQLRDEDPHDLKPDNMEELLKPWMEKLKDLPVRPPFRVTGSKRFRRRPKPR